MNTIESGQGNLLNEIIHRTLKPWIKKIDAAGYYPSEYLKELGRAGLLPSQHDSAADIMSRGIRLVEETARACMTTAFNLWCHLAASTYLRESGNPYLRKNVLPLLENGEMLGGTGLSNPMKYYAGLESLCLRAKKVDDGYTVTGTLPSVSNLGPDHGFGIIATLDEHRRVMAFVPCSAEGLTLREKSSFLGLNGSATYICEFNEVFVPDEWMISEQADAFVAKIRSVFLLFQIPLGLGVTDAAIRCMYRARARQDGCSRYIPDQPETLERDLRPLRERAYRLASSDDAPPAWNDAVQLRLEVAYLTLRAVQADMLHCGGPAYLQQSDPSRRLREAYFLANLTPTIKHLEKMRSIQASEGRGR
ncbi:MAG: putative acyl-CoA dehydrogenase [Paenibacillus sp.]|jgi:alkylation response protein AidB-like acyl-CoA dehydrogenase|nr:putative acyl-CoA dehydrogenase [Paenibacillus sp.]